MSSPIYNFSAGPGVLPGPVLERARDELLNYGDSGMSVMEMSHRSETFAGILDAAEKGLRELLAVPDNYRVLFLQVFPAFELECHKIDKTHPASIAS